MYELPSAEGEEKEDVEMYNDALLSNSLLMNRIRGETETPCQTRTFQPLRSSAVSAPVAGAAFFVPSLPHKPAMLDRLAFQYEALLLPLSHPKGSAHLFADVFPFRSRFFFPAGTALPPELSAEALESICLPFPPAMPVRTADRCLVPTPAPLDVLLTPLNVSTVLVEVVVYEEVAWEVVSHAWRSESQTQLLTEEKEEVGACLPLNARPTSACRSLSPRCSSPCCRCVSPRAISLPRIAS